MFCRIAVLTKESNTRLTKQLHAQRDYVAMESDYSHFLEFPSSPRRSDFLLVRRKYNHGVERGRCDKSAQTNLVSFKQRSIAVDTNLTILARP